MTNMLVVPPPIISIGDFSTAVSNPQVPSDATDLEALIAAAQQSGAPLDLRGRRFWIDRNLAEVVLTGSQSLTILGGDFEVAPLVTHPFEFVAPPSAAVAVTAINSVTRTFPGDPAIGTTDSTEIVAAGHGCVRGDWIKLVADDILDGANNSTHRIGEILYVADVSGNSIFFSGSLDQTYTTNRRLFRLNHRARFKWADPIFRRNDLLTDPVIFLTVRSFQNAKIVMETEGGTHAGLFLSSCWMAQVQISGQMMPNRDASLDVPGYLVQDSCGLQNTIEANGADFRHLITTVTNSSATDDEWWKYGSTRGCVYSGVAHGCTSAAFDTHAEARGITFNAPSAMRSVVGEASTGSAGQLRGTGVRFISSYAEGCQHGWQFYAPEDGGCEDCELVESYYIGRGDAVRLNSSAGRIRGALVRGGTARCNNPRSILTENCEATIRDYTIRPQGNGNTGIMMDGDSVLKVRRLIVDLIDYTGSNNFDVIAFNTGTTLNDLNLLEVEILNGTGKIRSILNGNGCTGAATIKTIILNGATLAGGNTINSGSISPLSVTP